MDEGQAEQMTKDTIQLFDKEQSCLEPYQMYVP